MNHLWHRMLGYRVLGIHISYGLHNRNSKLVVSIDLWRWGLNLYFCNRPESEYEEFMAKDMR